MGLRPPPPAMRKSHRELVQRALSPDHMLEVFRRQLPEIAAFPIRVTSCRIEPGHRGSIAARRSRRIVYRVFSESRGGRRWENRLIGTVPATQDFLSPEVLSRCRAAQEHPVARPFRELFLYRRDLQMAFLVFPMDPGLPALAEITGPDGPRLLASHLSSSWNGDAPKRLDWVVRRYAPSRRCSLRIDLRAGGAGGHRAVHANIFADGRGDAHFQNIRSLWNAARSAGGLHVPQPLGYDADRRMLILAEANGDGRLARWIGCLERDQPLPAGIEGRHVIDGMVMAARALAELQQADCHLLEERTYRGELARLHRDLTWIRRARPELGGDVDRALDLLGAVPIDDERLVPAHGAFHHTSMITNGLSLSLLDWHGLCRAHPALDAACFLGRVREAGLRRPQRALMLEPPAAAFRREFLRLRPDVSARDLAAYEALILTAKALRAIRRRRSTAGAAEPARGLLGGALAILSAP